MSENLDLVRSIYADWERGDFSKAEWAHPDSEWLDAYMPAPLRSATGLDGITANLRQRVTAWEYFPIEADEFIELDADSVLALVRYSGRGKMSGVEIGERPSKTAAVFHLRDGKVTRYVVYGDRDRALADLGLEG